MTALIGYYWYGLILALLIGIGTAWWIWGYRPMSKLADFDPQDALLDWPPSKPSSSAQEDPAPTWMAPAALADAGPPTNSGAPLAETPQGEPDHAPDNLMMIKGISPELEDLLRSLGVNRFAQIATWMPEDIERIDGSLGAYKGRILRDEWIGQARLLANGDMATFNQRYGHL